MPTYALFCAALVVIGAAAQTFTTTTIATVQLSTDPAMRGRVMAMLLAITLGGTPVGAPIVGWIADTFGPRWALGVGSAGGFVAALVGLRYLVKCGQLRVGFDAETLSISVRRGRFRGSPLRDRGPDSLGDPIRVR